MTIAPRWARRLAAAGAVLAAAGSAVVWAQQLATADRVLDPGFWPTKAVVVRTDFLGPEVCAKCHVTQAETQAGTSMARTAMRLPGAATLKEHPRLAFRSGAYGYALETTDGQTRYTVTGPGAASASASLSWAFGAGDIGQTYLFEKEGALQETRLSYFESLRAADFTPGRELTAPKDVGEAMSRRIPDDEARRCFACHNTASTVGGRLDTANLIVGVTCEACHGPGRRHVELIQQEKLGPALDAIMNPARLDPATSVDFCGACHATFWDVKLAREKGLAALRSQPNRLQSSKCWGEGDARLTCIACHDPHVPRMREVASYDSRCLACHAVGGAGARTVAGHPGRACPVATESCVKCHMPKYEDPGTHHRFTDHLIRVVREKP